MVLLDEESLVDITSPKAGPCGQPTRLRKKQSICSSSPHKNNFFFLFT